MGGITNTGGAIQMMTDTLFDEANGARPKDNLVPRVAVVMTDGDSNDSNFVEEASDAARDQNIIMFSIGIRSGINIEELNQIANQPTDSYRFKVIDFDKIDTIAYFVQNKASQG